jgi:hypothetical protein
VQCISGAGVTGAHCVERQNRITSWGVSDGSITVFRQLLMTNFSGHFLSSEMKFSNMSTLDKTNILILKDITISLYFGSYDSILACNFVSNF